MGSVAYDVIIVGGGSAGCTLAARLTEDADRSVLLIEAGGWDNDPMIRIPLAWPAMYAARKHDWMYNGEPELHVGGRVIPVPRGKVMGGSSSINAMAYARGHRADFDRWASRGLDDWSYSHVLPYFRRQETWAEGSGFFRGGDGPLQVREGQYADPLIDAFGAAGEAAGHPATRDYNGAQQHGFCRMQFTIGRRGRSSASAAYLRPALHRSNLTVIASAIVHRVLLHNGRASAVQYLAKGRLAKAVANEEVILCAGAVNSPKLLMLSGIGDPAMLAPFGIATQVALPGVGANLQDHIGISSAYRRHASRPGPFLRSMRADRVALAMGRALIFGDGPATELPLGHYAFLKSESSQPLPDVHMLMGAGSLLAAPWLRPFKAPFEDGFLFRATLLRPESRGRIELASADPDAAPRIIHNFLATERDRLAMRRIFRTLRDVTRQRPLQEFVDTEVTLSDRVKSDADIDAFVRDTFDSLHHLACTCRMGPTEDPLAVVDTELRVRGVEGLRVVDASVMPDMIGGNLNAPVIMIAEKAADIIRSRPAAEPIDA